MSAENRSSLVADVDFGADGKQTGFVRLFHSVHSSAYGFIPIPIVVVQRGPGPTALLIAGNHGDEFEGQVALCELVRSVDVDAIRGRIIVLPMANFPAACAGTRTSSIDGGNLNRSFPGSPTGTVTQQIAFYVEHELIPLADVVCDLHSGGSSLLYLPSALIRRCQDPQRHAAHMALLHAFGAPHSYITRGGHGTGSDETMRGACDRQGPLLIGTELGGANTLSPAGLAVAQRGIRNILVHMGILPASMQIPNSPTRILEIGGPDYFVYAQESGVFEPCCELGDAVRAGQLAGRIHAPETPWAAAVEHRFQRDGVVLCKRVPGRTVRGDCLFHLGSDLE